MSKKLQIKLGIDRQYQDYEKASEALIQRFFRSRYQGLPGIYYKPFCPYLESPNPRPDDTENTDTPLKICGDIIMSQSDQIVTMARERWVENKALEQLSRSHGMGTKRIKSILKTLQFKIVGKCIEPYRKR